MIQQGESTFDRKRPKQAEATKIKTYKRVVVTIEASAQLVVAIRLSVIGEDRLKQALHVALLNEVLGAQPGGKETPYAKRFNFTRKLLFSVLSGTLLRARAKGVRIT
jgi:hypothetical protein